MRSAAPTDHYQPVKGGRNAPLVATYAHTTPLVPPVSIATAPKQAVVTDVVTNIKPSQQTIATTATTVATTTAVTQPVVSEPVVQQTTTTATTTQPVVSPPVATQAATTTATQPIISAPVAVATTAATQQVAAAPLATPTTTSTQQVAAAGRPTQVMQTIYPTSDSGSDVAEVAAVGAAAGAAGVAATRSRQAQPVVAQTTTTQTTAAPVVLGAAAVGSTAAARKGLDLDVTATGVDSYSAPTPIHLTIHPDPTEDAAAGAAGVAANTNAIAYLHSVHPALPVAASTTTGLQQPQPTHARRGSEGAATSLNGMWTPMTTGAQGVPQQSSPAPVHGDQVYASEAPVIPARPMEGSMVMTNEHDHMHYASRGRVDRDVDVAAGAAAGAALGAGAAYRTELPISSAEQVQQVGDVSQLSGDGRTAVPLSMAAAGPMVVGETRQVGSVERVSQVDQVSGVTGERVAVATTQREMPAAQTFTSTTAPQVVMVPGVATTTSSQAAVYQPTGAAYTTALPTTQSERILPVEDVNTLSSEGRMAVPVSMAAAGLMVMGETRELGGVERISQVDQASGMRGERVALASMQSQMPAAQTFTSTTGLAVVQVDDATNLQGGFHTPVMVDQLTTGSRVIGETHEVGLSEPLEEVDDVSRISQGVPVAVTSTQRVMPAGQVFTSTTGPEVVHVPGTYTANIVQPTGVMVTQRLDSESLPGIVQVDDATAMSGERLALEQRVSTGAMVTTALPVDSQFESVSRVSHASQVQGEMRTPVMVENVARGPLVVGETQQLGAMTNIMQVNEMRGERLPLATTTTTTGNLRTYELAAESTQPQISYTFDQSNQASVQPVYNVQNVQAVQNVQTVQQTVQPAVVEQERTTVTREAVSAEEAAMATTTQPLATQSSDTTYQSLTTQQAAGLEEQHQRIDGQVHILYVDKSRMEGRETVPVGPYGAFTKEGENVDTMSGGVKGMQLNDSEQQTYTKEQI